jgi:phenylalanine-4-hydroxylase
VDQADRRYTPVDQAVWRFALRQLRSYLKIHAHEAYVPGLTETGIDIETIPRIEDISAKIARFGWRALPVSGFIPPAAFMELQALNVLPIASDIRSIDHLLYTPAPDIIHEAAGHAPMLAHPEFARYLTNYAQVAKKALISAEDMSLYRAIRELSDVKENPASTTEDIRRAEEELNRTSAAMTHVSEATWLSRMNWWTAEYGLIGPLEKPRIFGAGLLSSVGEARLCLSDRVKKLPLTIDCIEYGYDITEPQPQLFVTPDFETLNKVLDELAAKMAFRLGGLVGVQRAIQAATVNTVELNSGLQISGKCEEVLLDAEGAPAYLRFNGPSQLSFADRQLPEQGPEYHRHGFGTPVGRLRAFPETCPSRLGDANWSALGARPGGRVKLEYASGVTVEGDFNGRFEKSGKTILLSLTNARAELRERVLFEPSWGTFDVAIGSTVTSVFGGPADRGAYGETDDFVASRVPAPRYSELELRRHAAYAKVRELREAGESGGALVASLRPLLELTHSEFREDWLLLLELYELVLNRANDPALAAELRLRLESFPRENETIREGLALADRL